MTTQPSLTSLRDSEPMRSTPAPVSEHARHLSPSQPALTDLWLLARSLHSLARQRETQVATVILNYSRMHLESLDAVATIPVESPTT